MAAEPSPGHSSVQVGAGPQPSLTHFAETSAFLPRPEVFDERLRPGFRGGKALLVFFLCNAMPLGGVLYWLQGEREKRARLSMGSLPSDAEEVAAEVLRVIRTATVCFLTPSADAGILGGAVRVDPHLPEGEVLATPTEPLPLLPQLERNVLTDLLESPSTPGLGFIHLAVSRRSPLGAAILAGNRQASLLYVSHVRGAYCTVYGQVSVLEDLETRRRYWKGAWGAAFPMARPQGEAIEPPPPWTSGDYMLVRLGVVDVDLHAMVDGPQRWEWRSATRRVANAIAGGAGVAQIWSLVAPPPTAGAKRP